MKDSDSDSHFDLAKLPVEEPVRVRKGFTPKKVLAIIGFLGILIGCMFGIGVIAAYAGKSPLSRLPRQHSTRGGSQFPQLNTIR